MRKHIIILSILISVSSIQAKNSYMTCDYTKYDSHTVSENCRLIGKNIKLFQGFKYESKYVVTSDLRSCGDDHKFESEIYIKTGIRGNSKRLTFGALQNFTLYGKKGLILFDSNPNSTNTENFDKKCQLFISIKESPTKRQKMIWNRQKRELTDILNNIKDMENNLDNNINYLIQHEKDIFRGTNNRALSACLIKKYDTDFYQKIVKKLKKIYKNEFEFEYSKDDCDIKLNLKVVNNCKKSDYSMLCSRKRAYFSLKTKLDKQKKFVYTTLRLKKYKKFHIRLRKLLNHLSK